jgi:hypothetical protein
VDDVEEGLVAGPDDPVAEHVRVGAAPLAGDRVDVVDVLGPEVEQEVRHVGDELALADARLELLGDQLVGAVHHRAGRVEQHDLVDRLDLAGVEHHLLGVEHRDPLGLERRNHRRLGDVDAERHVEHALGLQDLADLAGGPPEQAGVRSHRATQPDHPGVDVVLRQPRAVQAVMLGGRAEVPDVGAAAARLERVARHLVAGPLADVRAGDVADVVEVEQQHGAEVGGVERGPGAAEAIGPEAVGVDALLPVDGHGSRRRERPHRILPVGSLAIDDFDGTVH